MYDRILLAVDGSDQSERAARRGLELAGEFDAAVDVLHVVESSTLGSVVDSGEQDRLRDRGESILDSVADLANETVDRVTTELAEGNPAEEICAHADRTDVDLVVVGRQGVTVVGERLLGGVTDRVLRRSDRPVLVVPDGEATTDEGYADILVPTDGSETAAAAGRHAVQIATRYGATAHVLSVVDLQTAGGPFSAGGLEPEFVERLEQRGADAVEDVAESMQDSAPDLNVKTTVETTKSGGGAAAGIRDYVTEAGVSLVVIGSRGQSRLRRHVLGSVTASLLQSVDVPVLVVPPAE